MKSYFLFVAFGLAIQVLLLVDIEPLVPGVGIFGLEQKSETIPFQLFMVIGKLPAPVFIRLVKHIEYSSEIQSHDEDHQDDCTPCKTPFHRV